LIIVHLARACYPFHPFGGMEQHVYRHAIEMAHLGHTLHLYTQPPDPGLPPAAFQWPEGVQHHYLNYHVVKALRRNSIPDRLVNYPLFSVRLASRIPHLSPTPQIVYAQGLAGFGYARQPIPGVPLVLNPQGMEEFKNKSRAKQAAYAPVRAMLRYTAQRSAAVIATDRALIPEVMRFLRVSEDKVCLLPNALDLDGLDQKLEAATKEATASHDPDKLLLLSVGRLEENKGFEVGLAALKRLEMAGELPQNWRWVLVGQGSLRGQLEAEAARLGLAERVRLAGALPDTELYALYRQADLFLHPTLYEGSSLVTLEALGAGLPVVASAAGGLPDKIAERGLLENGRLAKPGDAPDLAAKLAELVRMSPESRHALGCNGRRMVEQQFSWSVIGQATVALYERLIAPPQL
jgi:glycogen synthase